MEKAEIDIKAFFFNTNFLRADPEWGLTKLEKSKPLSGVNWPAKLGGKSDHIEFVKGIIIMTPS